MLQLFTVNAHTIAEVTDDTVITSVQDALDIMATAQGVPVESINNTERHNGFAKI